MKKVTIHYENYALCKKNQEMFPNSMKIDALLKKASLEHQKKQCIAYKTPTNILKLLCIM